MRKGHGSTKVPNVKLRPAGKGKLVSQTPTANIFDDGLGDTAEYVYSAKKPLSGLVLCASGIHDKSNILRKATQLGARTISDLTDQVTHLICDAPGSAKYNYCVEHYIPVMKSSWIVVLFSKWVDGEDINLEISLFEHRLPAFMSVRLCTTGIIDLEHRAHIQQTLEENGGVYVKTVDGNANITHLLCGDDRSGAVDERGWTEKMKHVDKLNGTGRAKIMIIWDTWFSDCEFFQGRLKEDDYVVTKPRPRGKTRVEQSTRPPSADINTLEKAPPLLPPSVPTNILVGGADVDEVAVMRRIPESTAHLWKGLLKQRGFEVKKGKLVRSPSKSSGTHSISAGHGVPSKPVARPESPTASRIGAFRRTQSFAHHEVPIASSSKVQIVTKDVPTQSTIYSASGTVSRSTASFLSSAKKYIVPEGERNLFVGISFWALGDAREARLEEEIKLRGGTMAVTKDDADYIIVRLASGSEYYWEEADERLRANFRTECWLEQCMYKERICEADEHITFVPLRTSGAISGSDKLSVHISGLDGFERTSSMRLLKAVGIPISENFSRRNTHLLCPPGIGVKVEKSREWEIPVVNMGWLHKTASTGVIQDVAEYLVLSHGSTEDVKMSDITNSPPVVPGQEPDLNTENGPPTEPRTGEKRQTQDEDVLNGDTFSETVDGLLRNCPTAPSRCPTKSNSLPAMSGESGLNSPQQRRSNSDKTIFSGGTSTIVGKRVRVAEQLDKNVPSSNTPSPLKVPRSSATVSPSRMRENAQVLKDAISTLKRAMEDEVDTNSVKSVRGTKKQRPQAKRAASSMSPATPEFALPLFDPNDFPASQLPPNSQRAPPASFPTEGNVSHSIGVTYEDPVQREGQRRLKALLTRKAELALDTPTSSEATKADLCGSGSVQVTPRAAPKTTRTKRGKGKGRGM